MAIDNDEDLITFDYNFGFVNKAGKVLNVSPVIRNRCNICDRGNFRV